MIRAAEARYISGYTLWLRFNDGTEGEVDVASELEGEIFEPLRKLPGPLIARLGFEFLRPKTLVDAFEAKLALGEPATKMSFPNFSGEPEIWD